MRLTLTVSLLTTLDEADYVAKNTTLRLSHEEVFSKLRKIANGEEV